ncbi:MAG: AF1514 family protein [Syntrophobacterales bacterium]|jgi:hypothetical protein
MTEGVALTKDMLTNPIRVQVDDESLDFARAKQVADEEAKKVTADPMLLAWYNAKTGDFSPPVTCCGEDRPTWLIYAESRGGTICIDINEEEFVFVYRPFD